MKSLGVAEIGKALRAKEFSSTELTQQLLTGVTANAQLGTFLATDAESALAQARAADAHLARGEGGPLVGVPLAHKDIFVTRGLPSTAGSKMLAAYASPFDATDRKSVV